MRHVLLCALLLLVAAPAAAQIDAPAATATAPPEPGFEPTFAAHAGIRFGYTSLQTAGTSHTDLARARLARAAAAHLTPDHSRSIA